MDDTTCYCRNPQCALYGRMAPYAQLTFRDWHRHAARFRCQVCTMLVSARTGTAYAGIPTDATTYLRGATALAEGMSIRATGRLLSVDKDTVNHWLPVLGEHGWLTDKTQTLSFAGCFLVLKHKTRLATSSILLLRGHRWFRIRCAA